MTYIRFPWHVKVEDGYYAPGALIAVEDPSKYVSEGAEIVEVQDTAAGEAAETRPRRGRRKKEE